MKLYKDIGELLSLEGVRDKDGRKVKESDLGICTDASVLVEKGRIVYAGPEKNLKSSFKERWKEVLKAEEVSLKNQTVLPAFVEAHTHCIFAGDRKKEFELRNQGVSYQEIAKQGGGILSTVKATRAASETELLNLAQARVETFVKQGVGTLEVKSGYGLSLESELKMLKVARQLKGPEIISTFLGAHALPPEFKSSKDYIEFLKSVLLPEVLQNRLADRIDIFIERNYFSKEEGRELFSQALKAGLKLCIHADQMSLSGGTQLAQELKAQSADHVIEIGPQEIQNFSKSQTVAVLLPAADFYLKMKFPPARNLIDEGACVALATDFNPGSSPTQSLSFVGVLARLEMKMSLPEVLSAYTYGAAKALGIQDRKGCLCAGYESDFLVLEGSWADLFYEVGYHPVREVYRRGENLLKA